MDARCSVDDFSQDDIFFFGGVVDVFVGVFGGGVAPLYFKQYSDFKQTVGCV